MKVLKSLKSESDKLSASYFTFSEIGEVILLMESYQLSTRY